MDSPFKTPLQEFNYLDKYARFDWQSGRRETWDETVSRSVDCLVRLAQGKIGADIWREVETAIYNLDILPSARLLAMAGPAAHRDNTTIYNCSYIPVRDMEAFVEALLISMAGCGVGFSVEKVNVDKLPNVQWQKSFSKSDIFVVDDTAQGWADALRYGLKAWFGGSDCDFDISQIRPAGSPLRTKGGRASGGNTLIIMLGKTREIILERQGDKLRPIDAYDIMCIIGDAAVSGGMRRTAMIALIDADDQDMLHAKDGTPPAHRWNANNSIVVDRKLDLTDISAYMDLMSEHKNGEPGLFSRVAANNTRPARREYRDDWGMNPCGEIVLRPFQFCNLAQFVAREGDDYKDLAYKAKLAAIVATVQGLATNFPDLRQDWRHNAEYERIIGVGINGQLDCPLAQDSITLERLRGAVMASNGLVANALQIPEAVATTCIKPSGNTSTLVGCSSGMHPRWSEYYIRRARVSRHSPIYGLLQASGAPMLPENGWTDGTAETFVIEFPEKAPEAAITRHEWGVKEQLSLWYKNKIYWCDGHNPSCTVTYDESEIGYIKNWIYTNQAILGGITFLPRNDARYNLMPFEEISRDEYDRRVAEFPAIDWQRLPDYEHSDMTTLAQQVACSSGACELL